MTAPSGSGVTLAGRSGRRLPAAAVVALALAGCASGPAAPGAAAPGPAGGPALTGPVTVFAAASLTGAFGRIGADFQAAHPGVEVTFNFGASSALARQIVSGAPADVFAAASPDTMRTVTAAGAAAAPQVFVRNRLQIAVPAGNPGRVSGLADFADEDRTLALCAPQVPCGAAAATVLRAAGVTARPDTLEQDARATLSKVALGEVDAALVWRTDVLAAGDRVQGIAVPEADRAVNDYLVATLAAARDPGAARAFVAHVLSSDGRRILADAGFDRP
jgi:molybdate transport system substrate-binding protein